VASRGSVQWIFRVAAIESGYARRVTLQELRYLVALADTGHFGRAARACAVSQPTLSAAIKKLEDELGVVMVERTRRRVSISDAGRGLIAQARLVLDEARRFTDLAAQGRDPLVGDFRLGVIPTIGPYLLPYVVRGLRAAFPKLRLLLRETQTEILLGELRAAKLDAALLSLPIAGDDLGRASLYDEPFVLALPRGHALAKQSRVRTEALADLPLLLLEEGHCLRDQALEVCGHVSSREREEVAGASLETLRNMVAAGVGATLLPLLASRGRRDVDTVAISPKPTRRVALVWRKVYARTHSVDALAAFLREHLPEGVSAV
jgi:LysR family hydrogen peroxide-inducible transcriptional activator